MVNLEIIGVDTRIVILFQLQLDAGYQYSFLDFRLITARNIYVQTHKAIFNNHACAQFYNILLIQCQKNNLVFNIYTL